MTKRPIHVITSGATRDLRRAARAIKQAGDGLMIVPIKHMGAAEKALIDVGAERGGIQSLAGSKRQEL